MHQFETCWCQLHLYKIIYMKTLVTALLRSYTNIACQIGWLSAWLVVNMFLGIDGCQEHYNEARRDCRIRAAPDKNTAMQNVLQVVRQPSQTARQQTQPAQPSQPNPASPTHPHNTQPASHPNKTNCHKLYGFPWGLWFTVKSNVFAERTKHRKTNEFCKLL